MATTNKTNETVSQSVCHFVSNRIKIVLAKQEKNGALLSEQIGRNLETVSRWMTNKVQLSVEQFYDIAKHLDVDVKDLLVNSL